MNKKNKIRITAFTLSLVVFQTGLAFASPVEMLTEDINETLELTEDFSDARDSVSADEPVNAEKKDEVVAIEVEKEGDFSVGAEEISGKDEASEKEETPVPQKNSSGSSVSEQLKMPEPTADAADVKKDEKAELKEVSVENWWSALKDGDSFDIDVKMFKWPYKEPPSFSMGNGALTGAARLIKEDGKVYAEIDFKAIDMGSTVGHLTDFWYIENQSQVKDSEAMSASGAVTVNEFLNKFGKKCQYVYDGKYIKYIRIPLADNSESVIAGLESDFAAMGRQLCVLNFDFTNAIEKITGTKIEKIKKVGTPNISTVLSADGDAFEISIKIPKSLDGSDAVLYYMVGTNDDEDLSQIISEKNKYQKSFTVAASEVGNTFNVYAVGVKDGYENSVINMKKITFDADISSTAVPTAEPSATTTAEPSAMPMASPSAESTAAPTQSAEPTSSPEATEKPDDKKENSGESDDTIENGKYSVRISLYNASSDEKSMGDVAFENNSEAVVTVSGGRAFIEMASNPVSIPPYYSALQGMQFENKSGNWQEVKAVKYGNIKASDGNKEYPLKYLELFEFELPSVDEEYVPVRIRVPYTPMDDIVESDGGYIEARLKINWRSKEKVEDSYKLEPNNETASGSSKYASGAADEDEKEAGDAVDTSDKKTGIKITANKFVFPAETVFSYAEQTEGAEYENAANILGDSLKGFKLYTISAKSGKDKAEPSGFAMLHFPIGAEDTAKTVIYRITAENAAAKAGKTQLEHEISEDGKYYVVSVKELGTFAVGQSDMIAATPEPAEKQEENISIEEFEDIDGHWAYDSIQEAARMGLFKGIGNKKFAPELDTTRGMFVTVLGRLGGSANESGNDDDFTDVREDDYFAPYVSWASKNGIMSGTTDNTFEPELGASREQVAAALCNLALRESKVFEISEEKEITDYEEISPWARESVELIVNSGLMKTDENGRFVPKGYMSRAEIAELIVKFSAGNGGVIDEENM